MHSHMSKTHLCTSPKLEITNRYRCRYTCKNLHGAWEMAQWAKCLTCKPEDMTESPDIHKLVRVALNCNPITPQEGWEAETGHPHHRSLQVRQPGTCSGEHKRQCPKQGVSEDGHPRLPCDYHINILKHIHIHSFGACFFNLDTLK